MKRGHYTGSLTGLARDRLPTLSLSLALQGGSLS